MEQSLFAPSRIPLAQVSDPAPFTTTANKSLPLVGPDDKSTGVLPIQNLQNQDKAAAVAAIDGKIADVKGQMQELQKQMDSFDPNALQDHEVDALEEAKLRAGADAYMPADPNQANEWLQRADALRDKQQARLFTIQQQNDPNSPGNVTKISSALNSLNFFMASPAYQAMDADSKKQFTDRALALQDQLSQTNLGSAFAGKGDGSSQKPTGIQGPGQLDYNNMISFLKDEISKNPPVSGILPVSDIKNDMIKQFSTINEPQNAPALNQAEAFLTQAAKEAQARWESGQESAQKAVSLKAGKDAEYTRWLEQNNEYVTDVNAGVRSIADLVEHDKDPNNAAVNMAIVDSFVTSAVKGKVTAYAANNVQSVFDSTLSTLAHLFHFAGQTYTDTTVKNAALAASNKALLASKALLNSDPTPDKSFYDKFMAGPIGYLSTVKGSIADNFKSAAKGGTPAPTEPAAPSAPNPLAIAQKTPAQPAQGRKKVTDIDSFLAGIE